MLQRCGRCRYVRWPIAPLCPECLSAESTWSEVRPTGTLWSYVVYHRALSPAFADEVPYAVGLVVLATVHDCRSPDRRRGEWHSCDERVVGGVSKISVGVTLLAWEQATP